MSRGIPRVREWIVTTEDGVRHVVLAPTRRLALLNFRHNFGYAPVRSVGVPRKWAQRIH